MKTKLTLSIDEQVIAEARQLLEEEGKNLSKTFENYLKELILRHKLKNTFKEPEVVYNPVEEAVKNKLEVFKLLNSIIEDLPQGHSPNEVKRQYHEAKYG